MSEEEPDEERRIVREMGDLHRTAVRWLGTIILVSVVSIAFLAFTDSQTFDVGLFGGGGEGEDGSVAARGGQTDQAVSILGTIASAGIGGLVGWITRDFSLRYRDLQVETVSDRDPDS